MGDALEHKKDAAGLGTQQGGGSEPEMPGMNCVNSGIPNPPFQDSLPSGQTWVVPMSHAWWVDTRGRGLIGPAVLAPRGTEVSPRPPLDGPTNIRKDGRKARVQRRVRAAALPPYRLPIASRSTMSPTRQPVRYKHFDVSYPGEHILQVTINRPDKLNCIDKTTSGEIAQIRE